MQKQLQVRFFFIYLFKVSSTYAPMHMASTLAHDERPNSTILYPSFQELVLCLIWYVWFGGELGGEQRFWSGKGDFDFLKKPVSKTQLFTSNLSYFDSSFYRIRFCL